MRKMNRFVAGGDGGGDGTREGGGLPPGGAWIGKGREGSLIEKPVASTPPKESSLSFPSASDISSSTTPSAEGLQLKIVHLVRHPQAVINSRLRINVFTYGQEWNVDHVSGAKQGIIDNVCGAMSAKLDGWQGSDTAVYLLRYEDLLQDAEGRLSQLYSWLGFSPELPESIHAELLRCGALNITVMKTRSRADASLEATTTLQSAMSVSLRDRSLPASVGTFDGCTLGASKSNMQESVTLVSAANHRGAAAMRSGD